MKSYNFKEVESKWQEKWDKDKPFKAIDFDEKPKFYVLYEFFNVSGNLHMGHLKGTIPADALARYKRFNGYNVLFPIGGDAFGLPAENAAIKHHIHPKDFVRKGMDTIIGQSKKLGLSFDYDRIICTSDPEYYHWTQWIFLQLFNHGKAYKQKGTVNFCPNCKTVLSNEDSQNGKCDRCGGDVIQAERNVWFLKMKEYSEKLLQNVDRIEMEDSMKEAQRNWIGKSEGIQLKLDIVDKSGKKVSDLEIFTTCIETVYGITFVVLAPENNLIDKLKDNVENYQEILNYRKQTALKSELDRISQVKDKTGAKVEGLFAINPITGAKVPVYIADFVLNNYGTGAVMAVPCHDQRDYEFAKAFNIPMIQVIEGDVSKNAVEKFEYIPKNYKMMNSGEFTGMKVKEAKQKIADMVEEKGFGKKQINYKMQDWPFNRQRYWGEPFPVIICDHCGIVPLEEKDLPLELPTVDDYMPNEKGDSPLSKATDWLNCKCPKCGRAAKRESDTMPNWAGSSWYWLRYIDPHNDKALADPEKLKYWGSVDVYTGGREHVTRHILYAFFWQNFLYEIGAVPTRDPFTKKFGSGLILDDQGKKMSKSSTNGVSPLTVIDEYGVDATRLHLHFLGAFEDNTPWTYNGINGIQSFLGRVWSLPDILKGDEVSEKHKMILNKTIKKVGEDIENFSPNTAIAQLMTFIKEVRADKYITKEELRQFLIVLNPYAPHITSELYEYVFGGNILNESWPKYDEKALVSSTIEIPVQVNGKLKATVKIEKDSTQDVVVSKVKEEFPQLADGEIRKIIYVPNKILNIIK